MPHTEQALPQARTSDLVTREANDEVLVYDLRSHKAHCLNKTAAFVWSSCDGQTTIEEIASRMSEEWQAPVEVNIVWLSLKQLEQSQLLQNCITMPDVRISGLRE